MEITVRASSPDDYLDFYEIFSQPKAFGGTLQLPYPSPEFWKKRLENPPENLYNLVACVDGKVVGALGLEVETKPRRKHAGNLGMGVHDAWHSKGIGTALMASAIDMADNWLNLIRLELGVFVDNQVAIGLYKKFGFKHEGTFEKFAFRDGAYVDIYRMARIRP